MPRKPKAETVGDHVNKVGGVAADRLQSGIDRIERLREEKKELSAAEKDIFAEMKSAGFDVVVMREVLKRRAKERAEIEERDTLVDLYERALAGQRVNSLAATEDEM